MRVSPFKIALYTFLFALTACTQSFGQPDVSRVRVSTSLLQKHVFTLAADSLEGRKTGTAGQRKAALYCTGSFRQSHLLAVFRLDSVRGSFRQPYAFTTTEVALFGSSRTYGAAQPTYKRNELAPLPLTAKDSNRVSFGDNLAGLLIGTDLKQEVVVLSAHYDHLGRSGRQVFHGADDNASGTATVLSVAAVFDSLARQGIKPRRSVLFVLFSGEEGGLLGSQYFVANSPIPLNQFVCDLNVDMIGRVDEAHRKKPDYCYIIKDNQGSELQLMAETANRQSVNLAINEGGYDTKNDPDRHFYRSDHYNFAKLGIPVLFFTSGQHPDYHQPSDSADKIDYDILEKRATLVFQTAWRVANSGQ